MYAAMQNIILYAIKGDDFKSEMTRPVLKNGQVPFSDLYHDDIDLVSLTTQLELLPSVFKEPLTMQSVFKQAREMSSSKRNLISQVVILMKLIMVAPATMPRAKESFLQ